MFPLAILHNRNGVCTIRPQPVHRASVCVKPLFSSPAMVRVSIAMLSSVGPARGAIKSARSLMYSDADHWL